MAKAIAAQRRIDRQKRVAAKDDWSSRITVLSARQHFYYYYAK
ncbi:hypothetical protein [Mycobacterium sp.]